MCARACERTFLQVGSPPPTRPIPGPELIRGPGSEGIITLGQTVPRWCARRNAGKSTSEPISQQVSRSRTESSSQSSACEALSPVLTRLAWLSINNHYFRICVFSSALHAQQEHTRTQPYHICAEWKCLSSSDVLTCSVYVSVTGYVQTQERTMVFS